MSDWEKQIDWGEILVAQQGALDEVRRLREENARLRWVVKGAHGALADAATVVVPGALHGDLKPAIRQITRERDEARAKLAKVVEALLRRGVSRAPCDICGYNGPGYHQPETHPCIADADRLRAATAAKGE